MSCRRSPLGSGLRVVVLGQAFDLLDVEDGVSLHERDFALDVLAVVVGFGLGEAVGIDDERAMLALADLGVEFGGLLVGHPDIGGVTLGHGFAPQQTGY